MQGSELDFNDVHFFQRWDGDIFQGTIAKDDFPMVLSEGSLIQSNLSDNSSRWKTSYSCSGMIHSKRPGSVSVTTNVSAQH